MNEDDPQSSGDVARDAESARAGLARTLGDLRDNLTPENIAEEVVGNAKAGVTALLDNVSAAAREHPLPALLIGAGLAMVFGFGARSAVGRTSNDRDSGDTRLGTSNPQPFSSKGYSSMDNTMSRLPTDRSGVQEFLREQPLVVAALGIAVGAAIGAVLPASATENEWMGSTSASARQAARDAAQGEMDHLKDVVSRTAESVKRSAAERGLSSDNLGEVARAAGGQVKAAVHEAIADVGQPKTGT